LLLDYLRDALVDLRFGGTETACIQHKTESGHNNQQNDADKGNVENLTFGLIFFRTMGQRDVLLNWFVDLKWLKWLFVDLLVVVL